MGRKKTLALGKVWGGGQEVTTQDESYAGNG